MALLLERFAPVGREANQQMPPFVRKTAIRLLTA
jgi:hypothetical protein